MTEPTEAVRGSAERMGGFTTMGRKERLETFRFHKDQKSIAALTFAEVLNRGVL